LKVHATKTLINGVKCGLIKDF